MSTECEFGKTNIWRRRVAMVAQQWESTWCQWTLHLKMVKLIHFMYILPQLKERRSRTYGKITPIYRRLAIQIPKKMLRQCLYITKGRFNWHDCFPTGCSQLRDGSLSTPVISKGWLPSRPTFIWYGLFLDFCLSYYMVTWVLWFLDEAFMTRQSSSAPVSSPRPADVCLQVY